MKKKIKRAILILAALLLVAGVALSVTNPSSNDHLNVIADYLSNYDMSQIDLNEEEQAQYTAYMSSCANANRMDKVVKPMFRVQDYGLWSVGKINEKNVTLGILNKVMIIDGDQIPKALVERNKVEDADK